VRSALLSLAASNDLPAIDFSVAPENFSLANSMGWMFDN
jgi:hypothetical protein